MSSFLMPEKVISILKCIMRNFFWEGHNGGKMNHLVKWELVTRSQEDGGLGLHGLRNRNSALLAKWGFQFMNEENAIWCKVVKSIHGRSNFNWHAAGKASVSLRSLGLVFPDLG